MDELTKYKFNFISFLLNWFLRKTGASGLNWQFSSDEGLTLETSAFYSLRWPIYVFNSVVITELHAILSHRRSITFSLKIFPLFIKLTVDRRITTWIVTFRLLFMEKISAWSAGSDFNPAPVHMDMWWIRPIASSPPIILRVGRTSPSNVKPVRHQIIQLVCSFHWRHEKLRPATTECEYWITKSMRCCKGLYGNHSDGFCLFYQISITEPKCFIWKELNWYLNLD